MARFGIAALLGVAACGGGDGGNSIPLDGLDEAYAEAFCTKLFACCNDAEAMQFGMILGFTDEASCKTSYQMGFDEELVEIRARVETGELTYDGEAAAQCRSLIDSSTCVEFLASTGHDACDVVFTGPIENGQPCQDDEDCRTGNCEIDDNGLELCTAIPGEGQACITTCSAGLSCANGTCITPRPDGEGCTSSDECASGVCDVTCVPQTTCDGND